MANAVVVVLMTLFIPYEALVEVEMLLLSLNVTLFLTAFLLLRWTQPSLHRPYRIPGGFVLVCGISVVPAIIVIANLVVGVQDKDNGVEKAMTLLAIVVLTAACQLVARCLCNYTSNPDHSSIPRGISDRLLGFADGDGNGAGRGAPIPLSQVAASKSMQGQRWGDVIGSDGSATKAREGNGNGSVSSSSDGEGDSAVAEGGYSLPGGAPQPTAAKESSSPKFSVGDGDDYEEF